MDWVHPHMGIVDLKTTSDLDRFEFEARRWRYPNQMAFYADMLAKVTDEDETIPVYLIAVEKSEPYRCGVWQVSEQTLDQARHKTLQPLIGSSKRTNKTIGPPATKPCAC